MKRDFDLWDSESREPKTVQAKKIGRQWMAPCPNHADSNPSLSINEEKGVFKCFGCGFSGPLYDPSKDPANKDTSSQKRLAATYDYRDEANNLLFQTLRYEPKGFSQRRPNGNGGWIWNLKGVEPVLYRLPEVLKAEEVIIVEGEKDADNAAVLGFCATTSPMGAGKWRDHYNGFLKGKDLILCPDNDPPGREHMSQIAASINGTARSLKWLDLPDLPEKGDISDWIATFQDPDEARERLAVMIENAGPYNPLQKKTIADVIITAQDFHSLNIHKRSEHLHPWLKEASIILITGERGIGKSFFAHLIASSIRKGKSCGPWSCHLSAPILIIDGEMSCIDLQERSELLDLNSEGLTPLYIYSDALANQYGIERAHLMNEGWRETVKSIILARYIKILILDNISSLASGVDENAKKDWDPVNQWLIGLRFSGVSTLMLHHTSKTGSQRGTSAREDNVDISILLKKPADYVPEDGCRFIVSFTKARVAQEALSLIADTEFKLIQDATGIYTFEHKNIRKALKEDILEMYSKGVKQNVISETLHVDKAYVSRIIKGLKNG